MLGCGVKKRQIIVDDYFRIYIGLFGHKASDKSFFITFGIDTADDLNNMSFCFESGFPSLTERLKCMAR